jgi:tRNA U34 5-methylaminomethyl-2-thiouridine-forming methyltransferase MnmC
MTSTGDTAAVEPVETADGSTTGRHVATGATYRSIYGALTEVRHVFIESTGLHFAESGTEWSVVELGFGLGTSFVETARYAVEQGIKLDYLSVEREPARADMVQHDWEPAHDMAVKALRELANAAETTICHGEIRLTVQREDWLNADLGEGADAVYFDPFDPSINPESWTQEAFAAAHQALSPRGRLATYSAAGHVRRALARSGFRLATRPGPGRKREITVAAPTDSGLGGFERLSMERYLRAES